MYRIFHAATIAAVLAAGCFLGDRVAWSQAATTVQLPQFGIAIDAEGVLSMEMHRDPGGRLRTLRLAEARAAMPADLMAAADLRKVSLVKLEKALRAELAAGREPDAVMKHLAGLLRVQYVFFYPETNDIVIAGPAEGWVDDGLGRAVGATTGQPVLQLEDLATALRAFPAGGREGVWIGCSIDPDAEGLARLQAFQRTVPRFIAERDRAQAAQRMTQGTREALGMGKIRVFGVSDKTHFARVMIEADYRMKMIGIGLEPPPVRMTTFIDALSGAQHSALQRWWFTPQYDCVRMTADGLALELLGQGVQLQCETNLIGADGSLTPRGARPDKASELFTLAFTRKYPEIAQASPVYAQFRNLIDLSVAAAFLRKQDYYGKADWNPGVLVEEASLPTETLAPPQTVPCVVNSLWKGSRAFTAAGGGVSLRPELALEPDRVAADERGLLARQYHALAPAPVDRWWWD
ncbi:DUF1598 domain-containing protein [Lignipirellula cremea]|uniref:DUF1598 domain-containing protein n=1 Tax=Lignipirellula cremea TaxID=2528010 RepID=A0A518DYM1_9BACT|nr:DUF1598 domain-containing protein [Lignipirellula cremea]QDU96895.1 hypothetical protein Pla8534_47170 [Lignipirellula cremea]